MSNEIETEGTVSAVVAPVKDLIEVTQGSIWGFGICMVLIGLAAGFMLFNGRGKKTAESALFLARDSRDDALVERDTWKSKYNNAAADAEERVNEIVLARDKEMARATELLEAHNTLKHEHADLKNTSVKQIAALETDLKTAGKSASTKELAELARFKNLWSHTNPHYRKNIQNAAKRADA